MDTKLKSSNRWLTGFTIFFLFSIAVSIISSYPYIQKQATSSLGNYFEDYAFSDLIMQASYSLYSEYAIQQSNKNLTPYDVLIGQAAPKTGYNKTKVNEQINSWVENNLLSSPNLRHMMITAAGKSVESNMERKSTILPDGKVNIALLQAKYQFYAQISFDTDGNVQVIESYGANSEHLTEKLRDSAKTISLMFTQQSISPIRNITFLYAVPQKLYYDNFSTNIFLNEQDAYITAGSLILSTAITVTLLFALIVPYRTLTTVRWYPFVRKLPVELYMIALYMSINMLISMPGTLVSDYMNKELTWYFVLFTSQVTHVSSAILWSMNMAIWLFILSTLVLCTWLVKYITRSGFIAHFKKHSLLYKLFYNLFKFISNTLEKYISYANTYILTTKNNRELLFILIVNAIICSIFTFISNFGLLGILIYTVVLYIVLRKVIGTNRQHFQQLYHATSQIAKGNLEFVVDKNLGILEPLNQNLKQIQAGFKRAIAEEVKSQKMRTELISNISHDVKTPLTSIITYIDLLKNDALSLEQRTEYVGILERKAQTLQHLVEDLFEISKLSSGNVHFYKEDIDVVSLMNQALFEVKDLWDTAQLTVKPNLPAGKVILSLDSLRTYRVFENLLINIYKYALPSTRVYIDIIDEPDTLNIHLKNISAAEMDFTEEEIVERFTRGEKSRHTEGSGLGLAIAKSLVELQGGRFRIKLDGDLFKVEITFTKK